MRKAKYLHNNPDLVWDGGKVQVRWQGRLKPLTAWAKELANTLGVSPLTIKNRVYHGWTIAEAFTVTKLREKPPNSGLTSKKGVKNEQGK